VDSASTGTWRCHPAVTAQLLIASETIYALSVVVAIATIAVVVREFWKRE